RPQVMLVEGRGPDGDGRPPLRHGRRRDVADLQAAQRIVGREPYRGGCDHGPTLARRRGWRHAHTRATPSSRAASATAFATAGTTRSSNGDGITRSAARSSPTRSASARAAASFIPSVIADACTSSAPRNTAGNARTLLIWFG